MKWYMTFEYKKMKTQGGAFWPVVIMRDKKKVWVRWHEEVHMINQLALLLIPWLVLYGIFHLMYGIKKNPFEVYADYIVETMKKPTMYGWVNHFPKSKPLK